MSFTERTTTSWGSRIKSALTGIIGGFILLIISIVGIFWNEGRAVATYQALDEGQSIVVSVQPSPIDAANEGKLVHVKGAVNLDQVPGDELSGLSAEGAVALNRRVEMYQWVEKQESKTEKKLGGSEETVTTYSYALEWSEQAVNSSNFKQSSGHENPEMPVQSESFTVDSGLVGDFRVEGSKLAAIAKSEKVEPAEDQALNLASQLGGGEAKLVAGNVFIGANPSKPQLGDLRVSYERLDLADASFVARQSGDGLQPYTATNGNEIFLSAAGSADAGQLFAQARADNAFITWIVRALCVLGLFIGFLLIFKIVSVLGDVVPFIGSLLGFGTSFAAFLLAIVLGPVLIALAWFTARPLLALVILALAAAAGFGLTFWKKKQAATAKAA